MKKLRNLVFIIITALLLFGCDAITGLLGEEGENELSYVETLVTEYITAFTDNRDITVNDIDTMKSDILDAIEAEGLESSEDLATLMPVIASESQISLGAIIEGDDTLDDDDLISYMSIISTASVTVISDNAEADDTSADIADIVVEVSSSMVASISESGIDSTKIVTATQSTVASMVGSLDIIDIDSETVLDTVADIASEVSLAVVENSGIDTESLTETLAAIPYSAAAAVAEVETVTVFSSSVFEEVLADTNASVATAVVELAADTTVTAALGDELSTTEVLAAVQTEVLQSVESDTSFSVSTELTTTLIATTIASAGLEEADVAALQTEITTVISASTEITITVDADIFDEAQVEAEEIIEAEEAAEAQAEAEAGFDLTDKTVTELQALGFEMLEVGSLDLALEAYQAAYDTGDASEHAILYWSALKLMTAIIDEDLAAIVENIGIQGYPTTLEEVIMEDSLLSNDIFPDILNQDMFEDYVIANWGDEEDFVLADYEYEMKMWAIMYNIQLNYPDGFDSIVDSVIGTTDVIDEVITALKTIEDTASFTYTYDMFNDEAITDSSMWPYSVDSDGVVTAYEITAGKAEVYSIAATLEMVRTILYYGQSVSLAADIDAYWDIFNPIDGTIHAFDDEGVMTPLGNSDYDWSTFPNPLESGALQARDDADSKLALSKEKFLAFIGYLDSSADLLDDRIGSDDFFFSPSNSMFSEQWSMVNDIAGFIQIAADKITASVSTDETTVVIPDVTVDPTDTSKTYIGDITAETWPDSGLAEVNLSVLFDKPFFALDSLVELDSDYEPVFYTANVDETVFTAATAYVEDTVYYIKSPDLTLGGLIADDSTITMLSDMAASVGMVVSADDEVFIPISMYETEMDVMVWSSLTAPGEERIEIETDEDDWTDEAIYTSTGSFYTVFITGDYFNYYSGVRTVYNSTSTEIVSIRDDEGNEYLADGVTIPEYNYDESYSYGMGVLEALELKDGSIELSAYDIDDNFIANEVVEYYSSSVWFYVD